MTSQMADRTVFVGVLQAAKDYVGPEDCILCIPGQADIPLRIEGEALAGPRTRAFWSKHVL